MINTKKMPDINIVGRLDVKGHDLIKRVYDVNGISPALNTCGGGGQHTKILDNYRVRKLTPREYARLQGFPDTYEKKVSDSQFYRQMGNAVTVNIAQAIAKEIARFLNEKRNF